MKTQWRAVKNAINDKKEEILLVLFLLSIYAYTFPRWADPNQNSRLNMVFAVVEEGTFRIDSFVANTVDYAKVGDHYYSDKAPGVAFLGIPAYAVIKMFLDLPALDQIMNMLENNEAFQATLREGGTGVLEQKVRFAIAQVMLSFLFAAIPTAIIGLLLYRLSKKFSPRPWIRAGVVITYGLLTPVFAYGGALYGHQLSGALVFMVFYLAWQHVNTIGIGKAILCGLMLAYSVVTEYPVVLIAGLVYLYLGYRLYQRQALSRMVWVSGSGLVVAIGWMIYNNAIFGGPLELGYQYSELWVEQHGAGFMSLTIPHWDAIWGITFSPYRGLFFYSPLLLIVFPGFILWWRSREYRLELWTALLATCSFFLFNASSIMWWGGFAIGPRYLLPIMPFMALAIVPGYAFIARSKGLVLVTGLLAAWSFIAVWGLTLAGQAFPSDTLQNPLVEYGLPAWQAGNVARNLGTIAGLQGLSSLIPLLFFMVTFFLLLALIFLPGGNKKDMKIG